MLKEKGYSLSIFRCHYDEIESNIQDSIEYAKARYNFKPELASPLSSYFYYELKEPSKMEEFKYDLKNVLEKYDISTDDFDYENEENDRFNIDENLLYSCIENEYGIFSKNEKENEKIWTDIKAISNIYRLRQGENLSEINSIKYIFLTNNSALSRANRCYKLKENCKYNKFQECLTDTFLGSYLWIKSNHENEFIKKRLLSDSYEYIQAKPEVKRAFLEKLEAHKDQFDEKKYLWLRSQVGVDSRKLAEKTCNIVDKVLDSTPEELLKEHDEEIRKEIILEKDKEIDLMSIERDKAIKEAKQSKNESSKYNLEHRQTVEEIEKISINISRGIIISIGVLYAVLLIFGFIVPYIKNINLKFSIPIGIILLIPSFLSFYWGITIKGFMMPLKNKIFKYICAKIKLNTEKR